MGLSDDWTHMLVVDLRQRLDFLRRGNIVAFIDASQRWYKEVADQMERRGLTDVPAELRHADLEREALYEALENHRVCFVSLHPATAGRPALWQQYLAHIIGMSNEEYAAWWEREKAYLIEKGLVKPAPAQMSMF